jgi:hypothetical protein
VISHAKPGDLAHPTLNFRAGSGLLQSWKSHGKPEVMEKAGEKSWNFGGHGKSHGILKI